MNTNMRALNLMNKRTHLFVPLQCLPGTSSSVLPSPLRRTSPRCRICHFQATPPWNTNSKFGTHESFKKPAKRNVITDTSEGLLTATWRALKWPPTRNSFPRTYLRIKKKLCCYQTSIKALIILVEHRTLKG